MFTKTVRTLALLGSVWMLGCGGGGSGGSGGGGATADSSALATNPLGVALLDPAAAALSTDATQIVLRGAVTGTPSALFWTSSAGGGGNLVAGDSFTTPAIPLVPGDNRIVVTAQEGALSISDEVLVIRTAGFASLPAPRAVPDIVFQGDAEQVWFSVRLVASDSISLVELWTVDAQDQPASLVGEMRDDGDLSGGDEIVGDGVYSLQAPIDLPEAGSVRLRAVVQRSAGVVHSPPVEVQVVSSIDPQAYDAAIAVQADALAAYEAAPDHAAGVEAALAVFAASPEVAASGPGGAEGGVWALYAAGFGGGLLLPSDGIKAGGNGSGREVGSDRALVLAPFFSSFETSGGDETEEITAMLELATCPSWDITERRGAAADLGGFAHIADGPGLVAVSSHGDNWYAVDVPLLGVVDLKGWKASAAAAAAGGSSVPVIATGEVLAAAQLGSHEKDLRTGRLIVYSTSASGNTVRLAVTPAYIEAYGKFPESIIYISACRSAFNPHLAAAFLAKGAQAFVGYDDYVDVPFAHAQGVALFSGLIEDGKTLGEAFTPGSDPDGAAIRMFGDEDACLPDGGLRDPSFESASLDSWNPVGDVRILHQLGGLRPSPATLDNAFMAMLSTGVGFSSQTGEISQTLCLPADATSLRLSWNFLSHEFHTYCNSSYQDSFSIRFEPDGAAPVTLHEVEVDDLCGSVSAAPGIDFGESGDPDGVQHTGWQVLTLDISALAGQTGRLVLHVTDVGDSAYDTAVLIDDLELLTAP